MPIPDFESIILPVLEFHSDGKERDIRDAVAYICDFFSV